MTEEMTVDQFWTLIGRARGGESDLDSAMLDRLSALVGQLSDTICSRSTSISTRRGTGPTPGTCGPPGISSRAA